MVWGLIGGIAGALIKRNSEKKAQAAADEAARQAQQTAHVQTIEQMKLADQLNEIDFAKIRDNAQKGGFNPISGLQFGGAHMGSVGAPGATPVLAERVPLASMDMLANSVQSFASEFTPAAAQRRQADRLNLELAKIKLDQARAGVVQVARPAAVNAVAKGPSPLGGVTPMTESTSPVAGWLNDSRRERDIKPIASSAGVGVINHPQLTFGQDMYYLTTDEGEPIDMSQGVMLGAQVLPQVWWNAPAAMAERNVEYGGGLPPWIPQGRPAGTGVRKANTMNPDGLNAGRPF